MICFLFLFIVKGQRIIGGELWAVPATIVRNWSYHKMLGVNHSCFDFSSGFLHLAEWHPLE